ncbi:MAG: hypothetical protein NVS2B16_30750 [Chloroflexota bacterium]
MTALVYHRHSRTPSSEQYELWDAERRIGHLDIHFGNHEVFATLVLEEETSEDDVSSIIEDIDENIVLSADVARDDLFVHVYVGQEIGLYSDEVLHDEFVADGNTDFADA